MAERTFTLQEAQVLLPVLQSLLKSAMAGKKTIEQIAEEFQQLARRVHETGGMLLDPARLAARKQKKEKAVQQVKDALAEIDATGVQVKDLDIGLLDFPCVVEEQVILLCWKLGEKAISHWHGADEGYRSRKPIDERIARAGKRREPS